MASITLKNVCKVYPSRDKKNATANYAVKDFSMDIQDNEFIVFVGPSGCGKSTTLRMIAGLESITSGEIYIGDRYVNNLEPKERDIAMVFQNYALYPHMTVYKNIAFGLKLRHVPKDEIDRKVHEVAKVLDIENLLQRKPREMSGGQRQRVALGRAIVRNPKVFLLDEPLSNLDAKLRAQMRVEITKLHKSLKTTFIYVTHDQVEAMTMGDRIVVMKDGVIQQIDTPTNLYDYPANQFVAGFIGTPQMNFFEVVIKKAGAYLTIEFENGFVEKYKISELRKLDEKYLDGEAHKVILGARGEDIKLKENGLPLVVDVVEILGNDTHVYTALYNKETKKAFSTLTVKFSQRIMCENGAILEIGFNSKNLHFFDNETGSTITYRPE